MKPFDLMAALAGEQVITRDGQPVKIAGYNPDAREFMRVVGWDDEGSSLEWRDDGKFDGFDRPSHHDLFMAPKKRTVWVNLYERPRTITAQWFDCEGDADAVNGYAVRIGGKAWHMEIEE